MIAESFNDALVDCVKACGGSKVVGVAIWPAKGVEGAQKQLLACLNTDRNEKLSLDEIMLTLQMARERGCHSGMDFLAETLGYSKPVPIQRRDAVAELQLEFIESTKKLERLADRIEKASRSAA